MASITYEITVASDPASTWDAVRDVGALHLRVAPGLVTDTVLEPGMPLARLVTFADGTVLREIIITIDDARRRLVWAIDGAPVDHHNGALQVFEDAAGVRVVWTADVLPDALAEPFGALMQRGLAKMKTTLEAR
jgi:hypothetical protein